MRVQVNKVRSFAGLAGVVATVTDAPEHGEAPGVMVWDFKQQPRRNPVASTAHAGGGGDGRPASVGWRTAPC